MSQGKPLAAFSSAYRRHRISMGLLLLAICGSMADTTQAQSATTLQQKQSAVNFNIPSQPVGSALNAFADATGWQVSVPTEIAAGAQSPGLAGGHTPEEGLQTLLTGTGLTYHMAGSQMVTIGPGPLLAAPPTVMMAQGEGSASPNEGMLEQGQSAQKPVKVPEIVVKDMKERSESYTADDTSTATRIPVPIQDVPRSVETVTRQVMDDQKIIRMDQALRNVSGTSMPSTQGGRAGDFMIRGFRSDLNVFKNGFREDSTFGARASRDVANLQNIEVIKGPPSYLYGRSDPGGVINQITKDPLRTRYYSGELIFGSYGLYRPNVDIGGPMNDSKTLTYRFNGVYENAQSYREGVKSERVFLAPTFGWEASSRDTFRLELEYLYDRSPIDRGIVAVGDGPANIPISRFLGDPTKQDTINQGKATLVYLHEFNAMWKWRTALRVAVTAEDYNSLESWFMDDASGILSLAQFHIPTLVQSNYMQNEVHGKFSTGSIKHKLLAGVELGWEYSKQNVLSDSADFANLNTIDIYNPSYSFRSNQLVSQFNGSTRNQIVGVYAGDQIDLLENLHMHVGGRYDYFYQKQSQDPSLFNETGGTDKQTDNHFSPSVGLNYQPIKQVAIFANYTQSFAPQPTISRSASGQLFKPETGEQVEGGFKFQFFEGKLRSTLAAFDIKKKNVLTADVSQGPGSGFSIATGEQQSTGFEFDVAGQVFPGFEIIANYAYIKARVSQDNTFAVGSRLPNAPLNQGSLWATYFFQEGIVKGFGAGVGMYAQSQRNGIFQCQDPTACQAQFELPGFVRMDAALYYRKPEVFNKTNLLAAINFTNLLDQRYFTGSQNFREIVYTGAPLTVLGSIKLEFN